MVIHGGTGRVQAHACDALHRLVCHADGAGAVPRLIVQMRVGDAAARLTGEAHRHGKNHTSGSGEPSKGKFGSQAAHGHRAMEITLMREPFSREG